MIVPSLDVRSGRLADGSAMSIADRARELVSDGAAELHVVDLDAAETGALANLDTLTRAAALNLKPGDYLSRNDSYHFFEATGDLLKTGLTQTNVMDVRVILIDSKASRAA